jgi:hypothetical protein
MVEREDTFCINCKNVKKSIFSHWVCKVKTLTNFETGIKTPYPCHLNSGYCEEYEEK